jgi:YYY domain-containing protein
MEFGLVVLWLAMYLVVGLAALPLAAALFPRFEDGGAALAVPLGLAVIAVVAHLVGHVAFGWPALIAGLVALVGTGALLGDTDLIDERAYAEAAGVFTVGFCLVVAVRAYNPAVAPLPIAIGEKMLDMGYIQASLRADALPPEDTWFAGRPVVYHYGGHMLSALLALLTGTAPRFGYNLALAGFYGSLVTAAYGVGGAVGAVQDVPRRVAGGLSAFFVGVAGNLHTAARVVGWLFPDSLVSAVPGVPERTTWTPGEITSEFGYFAASRVLQVRPDDPETTFKAATEFPMFSWVHADLHAHVMSQPFMLLAVALLFSYWRAGPATRRLVLVGALPPVVGLVGLINIWSFPTAVAVTALTLLFAPGDPADLLGRYRDRLPGVAGRRVQEASRRVAATLVGTAVVLVGAVAWTAPYWLGVVAQGPAKAVTFWGRWTPLGPLLVVHGAFLAVFAAYYARRMATERVGPLSVLLAGVAALGVAAALGAPAVGLTLPFLAVGAWLLRDRPPTGFPTVLVGAGVGLILLVELVSIEGERFNVIFKYYAHVWLFLALAAGVLLPALAAGRPTLPVDAGVDRDRLRRTGTALGVAVIALTGLYAGFVVPPGLGGDPVGADGPTLDGTAYATAMHPDEAAAIAWLNGQPGRQTIVTAAPGSYRWTPEAGNGASAPASLTGHPTVIGGPAFQQRQRRGAAVVDPRLDDVATIYEGSTEDQRALFDRYGVDYVYVGPAERTRYGLTVEDHPDLEVAFREGDVTVYAVRS